MSLPAAISATKMKITLRADARGGEICYTTDGSQPKPDSDIYREPIVLDKITAVRAQTFKDGLPVGFEAKATFNKVKKVEYPTWYKSLISGRWVIQGRG